VSQTLHNFIQLIILKKPFIKERGNY